MRTANAPWVFRPHSSPVVNRVPSAISTIIECIVSGVSFNLVQRVLLRTSVSTLCVHTRLNLQRLAVVGGVDEDILIYSTYY